MNELFDIKEQLKKLPDKPGVYLMKNEYGVVIYVGKAISLKNRVRQYFQSSKNQLPKVRAMVANITEFEYIITDSEIEALILESNLIKKNQPKYNVLLRDDKTFPYIKVTINEAFPRILKTRQVLKDGAKYFGPFTDVGSVNHTLDLLNKIYPLKKCAKIKFSQNHKVCLNYHIGQCLGICKNYVDQPNYRDMIEEIIELFQGKSEKITQSLNDKMSEAAQRMDFEQAAEYRDSITAIKALMEKQKVVLKTPIDMDAIAVARGQEQCHAMVFFVRQGKLTGRENYTVQASIDDSSEDIADAFIKQFYTQSAYIPKEIMISDMPKDKTIMEELLTQTKGSKVIIHKPQRGEKKALLDMVIKNVIELTEILEEKAKKEQQKAQHVLLELMHSLNLKSLPRRIEAYDISNTSGVDSVGSMVVFEEGKPKKSDYRRFKIKTIEGPNDYGSLQEIIYRRFKKITEYKVDSTQKQDSSFKKMPDILLIDGGEKQVKVVKDVLNALNIPMTVAGMVKDNKHKTRGIIFENKEYALNQNRDMRVFITEIQDEVHRFAITYHRSLREKSLKVSILDNIKGIGVKRKMALLKHFGSIEKIKAASLEELSQVETMNKKAAEKIMSFFQHKI